LKPLRSLVTAISLLVGSVSTVTAQDFQKGPRDDGGFGLKVKLVVSMPDTDEATIEKIVERGHFICPYSNATHGNIVVETQIA